MKSELLIFSLLAALGAGAVRCGTDVAPPPSARGTSAKATSAPPRVSARRVATANKFGGVQLFPTRDWYNLNISGATVAADSDADVSRLATELSAHGASGDYFQRPIGANYVNLVPYDAPTASMTGGYNGSHHSISPSLWPIADSMTLPYRTKILTYQQNADDFLQVVQTAGGGNPNRLWTAGYVNRISSGSWQAYGGAMFNLDEPYTFVGDTGLSTSGAPMRLFSPRPDEFISGGIYHVVDGEFPRSTTCVSSQWPLPSGGQGTLRAPCVPGGAKIRLKASFPETGYSGDALTMIHQLKNYGVAVADNGNAAGIYFMAMQTGSGGVRADFRDADYSASSRSGIGYLFAHLPIDSANFEEIAECSFGAVTAYSKGTCVYSGSNP